MKTTKQVIAQLKAETAETVHAGAPVGNNNAAKNKQAYKDAQLAHPDYWFKNKHGTDDGVAGYIRYCKSHSPDAFEEHIKSGLSEHAAANEISENFIASEACRAGETSNDFYNHVGESIYGA